MSWNFVRMLIIIISRSSLKLGHVGLKTRSLDQQATQVSDLGPLWPSCFRKRWFFSWNISSWCMPQLERFLNIWIFFYSYVQGIQSSVSSAFLRNLWLLNALEGTLFWKKMIFSWNISSWCMPKFDRFLIIWNEFYSYVQGKNHLVSSTIFVYLGLSYALYGTFFLEKKDDFSWTISSLCMPQLEKFLIIWQVFYPYVQGKTHWVSSTCPNLKDSLLYDRFSIHMYKARSIRYLQQFSSICVSLMPCTVHFLEKDDFSWNISSWCRPQLERFLIIWQVFYPYVQGIKHSVSSTIFLSLRLPHTQ